MYHNKNASTHAELADLLRLAKEKVEAMTPEQRRDMMREQRKSWVIGEMMLEHPELTREAAEALYLKACL